MKNPLTIALLAFALVMPGTLFAQDNARFPTISPDKFSAKQQEFAKLLTSSPRNGNVNNPPFKVYFRSPEFGLEAIRMSDYLRWGTGMEPRLVELTILMSARNWGSDYIWHAHYPAAVKGGLDPSVAADMAAGGKPTTKRHKSRLKRHKPRLIRRACRDPGACCSADSRGFARRCPRSQSSSPRHLPRLQQRPQVLHRNLLSHHP